MRTDEHGAAAVEMALILPVLFMLLFGIVVFGIQLFRIQSMEAAVREGGRLAAVQSTLGEAKQRVLDEQRVVGDPTVAAFTWVVTLNGAAYTLGDSTSPCTDTTRGQLLSLTASVADAAAYALDIPFVGAVSPDFASTAAFRCE